MQSGGTKVGEAKADLQGEWSVVLEKPLPAGDHALSLKITSPDGTRALFLAGIGARRGRRRSRTGRCAGRRRGDCHGGITHTSRSCARA